MFCSARHSYSPYSKFRVGAALLTEDGSVYTGTNIENINFASSLCAERVAMARALSTGIAPSAGWQWSAWMPPIASPVAFASNLFLNSGSD